MTSRIDLAKLERVNASHSHPYVKAKGWDAYCEAMSRRTEQ